MRVPTRIVVQVLSRTGSVALFVGAVGLCTTCGKDDVLDEPRPETSESSEISSEAPENVSKGP